MFKYALDSKYTRVLNMLLVLNMTGFWIYFSWNKRKTFLKKIWQSSVSWKLEKLFLIRYKKHFQSRFFKKYICFQRKILRAEAKTYTRKLDFILLTQDIQHTTPFSLTFVKFWSLGNTSKLRNFHLKILINAQSICLTRYQNWK